MVLRIITMSEAETVVNFIESHDSALHLYPSGPFGNAEIVIASNFCYEQNKDTITSLPNTHEVKVMVLWKNRHLYNSTICHDLIIY